MVDTAFTELRSPRLLLRRLRRDDLAALCAYRSLPEVARYQDWESFGPDEAARLIDGQSGLEPDVPGTWFQLTVIVAATGVMIGDCGLHCRLEDPRQMEVGITLAPAHHGCGYATEAIECLLDFVFGRLGKHRVTAVTDAENYSAAALFRPIGVPPGGPLRRAPVVQGPVGERVRVRPAAAGVGTAPNHPLHVTWAA